jgi:hypothetical protein
MRAETTVLNGRKAILAYLGRSSKSTWFKMRRAGLPVYHQDGRVWAFRAEVDAWRKAHDPRFRGVQQEGKMGPTGVL